MIRTSKYITLFAIIFIVSNTKAQRHKRKRPLSTTTVAPLIVGDSSTIPNDVENDDTDNDTSMSMLNDSHIPKLKRQRTHISGADESFILEQTDLARNFLDMNKEENEGIQLSGQSKRNRIHNNRGRGVDNINILEEGDGPAEIVNGVPMNEGDRPYLVALGRRNIDGLYRSFCGATVINPKVVLTAAHCVSDGFGGLTIDEGDMIILNVFDLFDSPDAISHPICPREYGRKCDPNTFAYIVVHPEFNDDPETDINKDFALIFLPDITDIEPVALNPNDNIPAVGSEVVTFGWGGLLQVPAPTGDDDFFFGDDDPFGPFDDDDFSFDDDDSIIDDDDSIIDDDDLGTDDDPFDDDGFVQEFPTIPEIVNVYTVSNEQCNDTYINSPFPTAVTPNQICATRLEPPGDACQGDSGGPLVYDFPTGSVQVGITSWGAGCADPSYPGVWARISSQYKWITDTICGEIGGEGCSDDYDGQDCFDLSDKDINERDTEEDDMLPGFIRTMIDNGQIESGVPVFSVRPDRRKQQKRERDMTRMLMNGNRSLTDEFGIPESIIGGGEAEENAQPYLVSIGLDSLGPICVGSIIKPNVILSSASCFSNINGRKIKLDWVDLGRNKLSENTGVTRIYLDKDDVWRHIRYDYRTKENDMALIFLNNVRSEIEPVMLNEASNTPETAGDLLEVSGWGVTDPGNVFPPNQYHIATLGYVPNDMCTVEGFDITDDMMCATSTSEDIRGPCTGDVGGPLIMETGHGPLQVGVTSVGLCRTKPPPPIITPSPDCPDDTTLLEVTIRTDDFPFETKWKLFNICTREVQIPLQFYFERLNNTLYTDSYCIPSGQEYEFTIFDTFGDGICCDFGEGSYTVTYGGEKVASGGDFEFEESTIFGNECPEEVKPDPSVYARVSSGIDWMERAIQCRFGDDPNVSSKSGKSGRPHGGRHTKASKRDINSSTKSSKKSKVLASTDKIKSSRYDNVEFGRVVDINMSF